MFLMRKLHGCMLLKSTSGHEATDDAREEGHSYWSRPRDAENGRRLVLTKVRVLLGKLNKGRR